MVRQNRHRVTKLIASGASLESWAEEGNSPVRESHQPLFIAPEYHRFREGWCESTKTTS
jgi:hypothetical protein